MQQVRAYLTKILTTISQGDLTEIDRDYGICHNVCRFRCHLFIGDSFETWDNYSGNYYYPVHTANASASLGYEMSTKWEGEQLKLRQELALHLLNDMDAIVARAEAYHTRLGVAICKHG